MYLYILEFQVLEFGDIIDQAQSSHSIYGILQGAPNI